MICDTITIVAPVPLEVVGLNAVIYPEGDIHNAFGVKVLIVIQGDGTGTLRIHWGAVVSENKYDVSAGPKEYQYALPPGTHDICAEIIS